MSTEIPQPAQQVLDEYTTLVHAAVPDLLVGLYLHGSLALGAFNPGRSDVDFIAVTSRRCTASDIARLQTVHTTLTQRYPQPPLEGSYLQWCDLGGSAATIPPHPHIHDGVLHTSGYHDINAVTWWVLQHHGIALLGPPPDQLALAVDWDELIAQMYDNLNSYWARFTAAPRRMAWLLGDFGVEWTVLGVLRQFYSFRTGAITSKTGAGRYALDHTPVRWHRLIREAIHLREGTSPSSYRFRILRALDAYGFLRFTIAACNMDRRAHHAS